MRPRHASPVLVVGTVLALAAVFFSVCSGFLDVPVGDVGADLLHGLGLGGAASRYHAVIFDLRLPRALGGLCVGGALGASGCMLQSLLRNPIASPTVLGTAQGAGFGAMLAIAFGGGHFGTLGAAFVMSMVAMLLVLALARTRHSLPVESVVVTGMAMALLFTALSRLLVQFTRDEYAIGRMNLWLGGGLWHITWNQLAVFAPLTLATLTLVLLRTRHLDLLAIGESDAQRLGLDVRRQGTLVLVLSCVLTSLAVCVAGMVAFVGLIVPHAARRLVGPLHRALLPASVCLGAILVVLADTAARTVAPPQEVPLTVVTSLIGVPCFLLILRALRARRSR